MVPCGSITAHCAYTRIQDTFAEMLSNAGNQTHRIRWAPPRIFWIFGLFLAEPRHRILAHPRRGGPIYRRRRKVGHKSPKARIAGCGRREIRYIGSAVDRIGSPDRSGGRAAPRFWPARGEETLFISDFPKSAADPWGRGIHGMAGGGPTHRIGVRAHWVFWRLRLSWRPRMSTTMRFGDSISRRCRKVGQNSPKTMHAWVGGNAGPSGRRSVV